MNRNGHIDAVCSDAALYALGLLPTEEAQRFEQRIASGCPLCREELAACSGVADELALAAAPVAPPASLKQRLMERIRDGESPASGKTAEAVPGRKIVRSTEGWRPSPMRGIEVRPLLGMKTMLVRMSPGTIYPEHDHKLNEQCLVVEGSITDTDGTIVSAGDFVYMPAGTNHAPIHTESGCTLLIAYTA